LGGAILLGAGMILNDAIDFVDVLLLIDTSEEGDDAVDGGLSLDR
jgi:hypothetical protein